MLAMLARRTALALAVGILAFGLAPSRKARAEVGPELPWTPEAFESTTFGGLGYVMQTFSARRHFFQKTDDSAGGFAARPEDAPPPVEKAHLLSWMLGYSFAYLPGSTFTDTMHTLAAGMDWEFSRSVDVSWGAGYAPIPDESYALGYAHLRIEAYFPLGPVKHPLHRKVDPANASEYYREELRYQREVEADREAHESEHGYIGYYPGEVVYPNFRAAINLGFTHYLKNLEVGARTSASQAQSSIVDLDGRSTGVELTYYPNRSWIFGLYADVYAYTESPDKLTPFLDLPVSSFEGLGLLRGLPDGVGTAFAFPDLSFRQSVYHELSHRYSLQADLSEITYATTRESFSVSLAPSLWKKLNRHWRGALAAAATFGDTFSVGGGVRLDYVF